jgi:zinc transporter, ZIP family
LASLSVVSTSTGICLARRVGDRPGLQAIGIGFSVGVMVAISLGELLPEARDEAGLTATALWAIAGAAVVGSLHFVIPHIHLVEEDRGGVVGSARVAYLVAFGLILHDVPEGFAMANAYVSTTRLGVLVAVAIVLHNIPEEFAMALPAVVAGRRRFLRRAAIASAAAEPVGAVLGLIGVGLPFVGRWVSRGGLRSDVVRGVPRACADGPPSGTSSQHDDRRSRRRPGLVAARAAHHPMRVPGMSCVVGAMQLERDRLAAKGDALDCDGGVSDKSFGEASGGRCRLLGHLLNRIPPHRSARARRLRDAHESGHRQLRRRRGCGVRRVLRRPDPGRPGSDRFGDRRRVRAVRHRGSLSSARC